MKTTNYDDEIIRLNNSVQYKSDESGATHIIASTKDHFIILGCYAIRARQLEYPRLARMLLLAYWAKQTEDGLLFVFRRGEIESYHYKESTALTHLRDLTTNMSRAKPIEQLGIENGFVRWLNCEARFSDAVEEVLKNGNSPIGSVECAMEMAFALGPEWEDRARKLEKRLFDLLRAEHQL